MLRILEGKVLCAKGDVIKHTNIPKEENDDEETNANAGNTGLHEKKWEHFKP